jgi:hypothetical protein
MTEAAKTFAIARETPALGGSWSILPKLFILAGLRSTAGSFNAGVL